MNYEGWIALPASVRQWFGISTDAPKAGKRGTYKKREA
jgi:hypothetical protein